MVTIKDILQTKPFQNAHLAAGKAGLDRQVGSVTVAEVPDAANWLQGGELVCTTAYFIKQGNQIRWFESIIKGGAAAVAIKTSRFLKNIPPTIRELADRHQIPLIELSHEISWPSIIASVMQLLSDQHMKLLPNSADIQRKLTNLVLNNGSAEQIAHEIALLIDQPVVIEDVHLNIITHAGSHAQSLLQLRLGEPVISEIRQSAFYQDVLRGVVKEKTELTLAGEVKLRNLIVPIICNDTVYGFLSALYTDKSYQTLDSIVLENGAVALSLQFMRQRLFEQTIQSKSSSLIHDLVSGRINTGLIHDTQFLNMDWSKPLYVVILDAYWSNEIEYDAWNQTGAAAQQIIQAALNKNFKQHVIGFNRNTTTIIVSTAPKLGDQVPVLLKQAVEEALHELEKRFSGKCKAGISRVCNKLSHLSKGYAEANKALAVTKSFTSLGSAVLFEQLGIHRLLSMITDLQELKLFTDDFLAPLRTYDQKHDEELTRTFHFYLLRNGNINRTAKDLFVHPNTVLYRMKKVQTILGREINSSDMRLTYLAALEAEHMLESK